MRTEALLVLAIAGCHGNGDSSPSDAAAIGDDASADAAPVTGLVTVTARTQIGDGAPDPTAIVIFTSPGGAVLATATVDANGKASATVAEGSDVTVLQVTTDPNNLARKNEHLTTIRGVKSGDQLVTGKAKDPSYKAGTTDNMTATWTPLQAAAEPSILMACADGAPNGTSTGPLNLTFHASCTTPTFDLLMLQGDMASVENYIWVSGQAHSAGGSFAIPDSWAPAPTTSTTIVDSSGTHLAASVKLSQVIGGAAMGIEQGPPTASMVSLHYAPIAVPTLLEAIQSGGPYGTMHRWVTLTTGSPATTQIDLSALPLPGVTHVVQDETSVTWSQSGSGSPDARVVFWAGSWTDANAIQHAAQWEILEPPSGTSTHLFPLPSAYAGEDPAASGAQVQGSSVTYVDFDNITSYDAVRAAGIAIGDVESYALATDHVAHSAVTPSFQPP
jgi:hypothetical protein